MDCSARCLVRLWLQVLASVFAAALEATPASVCGIVENWNDNTGSVTSDRHPEELCLPGRRMSVDFVPTSPAYQYVLRVSGGVIWSVTVVVIAVK